MNAGAKPRVAVLGGGVGAITAAFELTSPEHHGAEKYDVTVYQMGWRLGGKGASGRNARYGDRVEEHGLHIWLGFYDNAFRALKECYAELGRHPGSPLATWRDAMHPQDFITVMEERDSQWKRWDWAFARTPDEPGTGDHPSVWGYITMLIAWMVNALEKEDHQGWVSRLLHAHPFRTALHEARTLLHVVDAAAHHRHGEITRAVHQFASELRKQIADHGFADDDTARRMAELYDIACAAIVGLFEEGVVLGRRRFADLDGMELRAFLRKYGCHPSSLESAALGAYYDIAFAYKEGKCGDEWANSGAGTAIQALLKMCLSYRGAFMYEMQAGMGDTIFAPYYQVLRSRGVKFRFFHRVKALELADDGARIARIRMARQVDLRHDEYHPLVTVKDLPCWPSEPLYDQIVQGDLLERGPAPHDRPYDLESQWSGWNDAGECVLEADKDFDWVVLGISLAALESVADQLVKRDPRWAKMVKRVETVQTQAVQLWLMKPIGDLGWERHRMPSERAVERTVVDGYVDPLNSWADMSHLLPLENWIGAEAPQTLVYFCGPLENEPRPPDGDTSFPRIQHERVRRAAVAWFSAHTGPLWPRATAPAGSQALDWDLLVDQSQATGATRFSSQYWRGNIDPTERYVQTIAGTTEYRLPAWDSGYANLVLAGDWTDTGFCVGCVEAAAMSGMQASRAICGFPEKIPGEQ